MDIPFGHSIMCLKKKRKIKLEYLCFIGKLLLHSIHVFNTLTDRNLLVLCVYAKHFCNKSKRTCMYKNVQWVSELDFGMNKS